MQDLASATPAPQFVVAPASSTSARKLLQTNGAQVPVNVIAPTDSIQNAQTAIANAVQNGNLASALRNAGEPPPHPEKYVESSRATFQPYCILEAILWCNLQHCRGPHAPKSVAEHHLLAESRANVFIDADITQPSHDGDQES